MKTFGYIVGSLACAALALASSGCGGGTECGAGTEEVDGECVATGEPVECAAGTTLVGNECVPDGSVICETGTMFDMDTGTCVPDISGCAEGTVLVGGECVPEDETLTGDVQEPAEPNGLNQGDTPGTFTTPAVGEDVVIEGCITPFEDIDQNSELDADFDAYLFSVTEPTLLDITADGVGGLAGGFQIIPLDDDLFDAGWQRYGVDMTHDTSQRQVFLPKAGDYALVATDSRAIFGLPFGSEDTCYFITVANVEVPAPTPIADGGEIVEDTFGPDVHFYSYDPAAQDLVFGTVIAPSESVAGALTIMVNGQFARTTPFSSLSANASSFIAALNDSDEVLLVVDPVIEYAVNEVEFDFEVVAPGVTPMPMDDTVTITNDGTLYRWLAFDANEGDVVNLDLATDGSTLEYLIYDQDLQLISERCASCDADNSWLQLTEGGTYYVALFDTTDPQPTSFELTVSRTHVQPTAITIGTPIEDADLSALNSDFYVVDTSASDWLAYLGTPTGFEGDMNVVLYDRNEVGALDDDVFDLDDFLFDGTNDEGRIHPGGAGTYLVRVLDTVTPTGDETYDLSIADRDFSDLGTVDASTPVEMTGIALAADEVQYYLVRAGIGYEVTLTVTGAAGSDLVLTTLDAEEGAVDVADLTGDAGAETLTFDSTAWTAFMVEDAAGVAGSFDLDITAVPTGPYTAALGTLAFNSVCPGEGGSGMVHTTVDDGSGWGADDDGISASPVTLQFAFDFFGEAVTDVMVSTNGWASFATITDSDAFNVGIPDTFDPNSLIAVLWDDLYQMEICVENAADHLTVEWRGLDLVDDTFVEMQAVLHDDNTIDLIYGDQHAKTAAGTIGVENADGDDGLEIAYDVAGGASPGTSYTLIPTP